MAEQTRPVVTGVRERAPSWERKRKTLAPTGPEKVGVLPDATAPPTRPVNRRAPDGTNAQEVARPAQGIWKGQDLTPATPEPWGR